LAARYHFLSDFRMTTDRDAVWAALIAVEEWPLWWRWLKRIDVMREATSEDGVGAVYRNHIGSPTGYAFEFQGEIAAADRPRRLDLTLTGEIVGRIRYLLSDDPSGGTHVEYAQLVETPKWWMNLLAPIARPGFTWNHDKLMTDFGRGLAKASGGELVTVPNWTLRTSSKPRSTTSKCSRRITPTTLTVGRLGRASAGTASRVLLIRATNVPSNVHRSRADHVLNLPQPELGTNASGASLEPWSTFFSGASKHAGAADPAKLAPAMDGVDAGRP